MSVRAAEPHPSRRPAARGTIRSLADDLRARTDPELETLLRLRPDLTRPSPADLTSLAARASTRASVQRALDCLDLGRLQVLEALAVATEAYAAGQAPDDVRARAAELLGAPPHAWRRHLGTLWDAALIWRAGRAVQVPRPVIEALGPYIAGLAPPTTRSEPTAGDADTLEAMLEAAPEGARAVLDRLTWGPPVGTGGQSGPVGEAIDWLVRNGLLVPGDGRRRGSTSGSPGGEGPAGEPGHSAGHGGPEVPDQVFLPLDIALVLRGGRLHDDLALSSPRVSTTTHPQAAATAGTRAAELLELLEDLLEWWGLEPPRVLRSGGLAVRDLRALAVHLDVPAHEAAFIVELGYAAGLLDDDGEIEPCWAPTPGYDAWQLLPAERRWAAAVRAWLRSPRAAHLVGGRTATGVGINALSADASWPAVRQLRLGVLRELAFLPQGAAPSRDDLATRLRWRYPRRPPAVLDAVTRAVFTQAEWLGVTGEGALTPAGRALVEGASTDDIAAALILPTAVEAVYLQADLTAVAPGRLEPALSGLLRSAAEVESRGGAGVYRFTPASVRRALDTGRSADQLLAELGAASLTPVPQPLEYLVRDVARRHGATRVGAVAAYVRCDDEATLSDMLGRRELAALMLRRIAPTVLVTPVDPVPLIQTLRAAGFAPVAEAADGGVVIHPPDEHRATGHPRRSAPVPPFPEQPPALDLAGLIARMRTGEQARDASVCDVGAPMPPPGQATDPAIVIGILREATADGHPVWLGIVDGTGQSSRILFHPERLDPGRVAGTVEGSPQPRAFPLHRIVEAIPVTG